MPVDTKHPAYVEAQPKWERARDVFAGEDAVKAAGELYLPRLDNQSDPDYITYKARACFYNATSRTQESLVGLAFRSPAHLVLPEPNSAMGAALGVFVRDVDLVGNGLEFLARQVTSEVLSVGRCGLLVDWEGQSAERAKAVLYKAEDIWNWRVEPVFGRQVLTLVVLHEYVCDSAGTDFYDVARVEQLRVFRLSLVAGERSVLCEVWQKRKAVDTEKEMKWLLVESRVLVRRGRPVRDIPFLFVGPKSGSAEVGAVPLEKLITVNLDHYRLDADFKHGLHYTALPTAYVAGMEVKGALVVGSRTAWVLDSKDARCGYLEFTGQGLATFERALDRDERLMAVMGTRMLESQKRAYESAQTIELRQTAEHCSLGALVQAVSESLTGVLRWVCWWHSMEELPESFGPAVVVYALTQDFTPLAMNGDSINALVAAWEKGAISRQTMMDALRRGEMILDDRSVEEEERLVEAEQAKRAARAQTGT